MSYRSFMLFISCLLSVSGGYAQSDASLPPNAEAGKCYAKSLTESTQSRIRYDDITYPIYIGSDPSVQTEFKVLTLEVPETISHVKTWPDCIPSKNDNWQYTEEEDIPGVYEIIIIPKKRRIIPKRDVVYKTFQVAFEETSRDNWEEVVSYPVYIGTNSDVLTEIKRISIGGSTRWEKKKADRNCLSADPNDCLVWALVEVPPEIKTINHIPIDLKKIPSSDIAFRTLRSIKKGGVTEWREVLCGNQIKPELIIRLRVALINQGYSLLDPDLNEIDQKVKNSLVNYQKENGLPIGSLDLETLDALGINY